MKKIRSFFVTALVGGLVVILPATIVATVFGWIYSRVTAWIAPLTEVVVRRVGIGAILADMIVIAVIVGFCFVMGLLTMTGMGRLLYEAVESRVLRIAPGYTTAKEIVSQLLGKNRSPLSRVALVQIFQNETLATAFITDEHEGSYFTVFVPTGPNPTSGLIYHLPARYVHEISASVPEAMRSIIACGAGSKKLVAGFMDGSAGTLTFSKPEI